MTLPIYPIMLLTLAVALAGCASSGHELDQSKVAQIKRGETTKAQVREWLGKPEQIAVDDSGVETWTYIYVRASAQAQNFIPVVGIFDSGYDMQNQTTTVVFRPDGIVKSMTTGYGGNTVNSNLGAGSTPKTNPQ